MNPLQDCKFIIDWIRQIFDVWQPNPLVAEIFEELAGQLVVEVCEDPSVNHNKSTDLLEVKVHTLKRAMLDAIRIGFALPELDSPDDEPKETGNGSIQPLVGQVTDDALRDMRGSPGSGPSLRPHPGCRN